MDVSNGRILFVVTSLYFNPEAYSLSVSVIDVTPDQYLKLKSGAIDILVNNLLKKLDVNSLGIYLIIPDGVLIKIPIVNSVLTTKIFELIKESSVISILNVGYKLSNTDDKLTSTCGVFVNDCTISL